MLARHTFRSFAQAEKEASQGEPSETCQSFLRLPNPERDPAQALSIYAGTDNLLKIGEP